MFLRTLQCSNCGARLQARPVDGWVKCDYCGTLCQLLGKTRTGMTRTGMTVSGAPAAQPPVATVRWRWPYLAFPLVMMAIGPVVFLATRARVSTATAPGSSGSPAPVAAARSGSAPDEPDEVRADAPAPTASVEHERTTVAPSSPRPRAHRPARKPAERIDPVCHISGMQADRVKSQRSGELDGCLSPSAAPATAYFIDVEAIVEPSGKVRTAKAKFAGKATDPAALSCVDRRFRDWVYPAYGTMPMRCHFTVRLESPAAQ